MSNISSKGTNVLHNKSGKNNLSKSQNRRINEAIAAAKKDTDTKDSAQSAIPYLAMYPDGVCNYFTHCRCIQFHGQLHERNRHIGGYET